MKDNNFFIPLTEHLKTYNLDFFKDRININDFAFQKIMTFYRKDIESEIIKKMKGLDFNVLEKGIHFPEQNCSLKIISIRGFSCDYCQELKRIDENEIKGSFFSCIDYEINSYENNERKKITENRKILETKFSFKYYEPNNPFKIEIKKIKLLSY